MKVSRRSFVQRSAATVAAASLGNRFAVAQEPPIRIGTIFDLSGPFAAAGSVPSAIGTQIAVDLVNERGGVAGKYKVETVNARLPEQGRRGHQRGGAADQPGEGRDRRRRLLERTRRAAGRQDAGTEEDSLDHDGGGDIRREGAQPDLHLPRSNPFRPIRRRGSQLPRRQRQSQARRRAQGHQDRRHPRRRPLRRRRRRSGRAFAPKPRASRS